MADNGWESVYNQTQTTSASWTKLESGSTTGKVLGGSGATSYYYIAESLNFTNNNAGGSGLTIQGTVYLYIPAGLTITCTGGNASGTTGAGAGIELAAGNTLYIIGAGDGLGGTTVTAIGGNAANGSKGGDGTDATGNSSWLQTGTGGDGGVGGGGAGAGIGTRGGNGGTGGSGGYGYTHDWNAYSGTNGSDGTGGGSAGAMGNLYVDNTYGIKVVATGGNAGSSGVAGGGRGKGYIWDGGNNYTVAGGGGGGAGGFGGAAANIGTGGPGGGGGGGGAGGAQDWKGSQLYDVTAYGGNGGKNADGTSAANGAEANTTRTAYDNGLVVSENSSYIWKYNDWNPASGSCTMGNGGAGGGKGDNASNGTQNFGTKTYNITYQPVKTRVNGTNINSVTVTYSPSSGTSVVLPKNIEGYQWVLLVYGKDCSSNATIHKSAFTAENLTFYGGNSDDEAERTIVLSDVYGDIYFQEVASVCPLNNNSSNTDVINDFFYDANTQSQSYPITARLKDRTLYKDNHWNTICLPFDLTPAQFAASPLSGAEVKKLDTSVTGYYPYGGNSDAINLHTTEPTLVFYFADVNTSDETLQAGKPYLVRWANGTDLVDNTTKGKKNAVHQLDFPYVTVKEKQATSWSGNAANGGSVQFVGTFSPIALTGGDKTKFVLGVSDNVDKLYYPKQNISVNACRGYFIIPQAAANLFSSTSAPQIVMGFDDGETTSIQVVNGSGVKDQGSDTYYNLNGQRVAQPTKGLYIVNGKKVIVK